MKILVHEINENGFFIKDVLVNIEDVNKTPNIIQTPIPEGMRSAKWTGTSWVETAPPQPTNNNSSSVFPSIEQRIKAVEDAVMTLLENSMSPAEE